MILSLLVVGDRNCTFAHSISCGMHLDHCQDDIPLDIFSNSYYQIHDLQKPCLAWELQSVKMGVQSDEGWMWHYHLVMPVPLGEVSIQSRERSAYIKATGYPKMFPPGTDRRYCTKNETRKYTTCIFSGIVPDLVGSCRLQSNDEAGPRSLICFISLVENKMTVFVSVATKLNEPNKRLK